MCKEIRRLENKLVNVELANRRYIVINTKLSKLLHSLGYNKRELKDVKQESESDDYTPKDDDGEYSRYMITKTMVLCRLLTQNVIYT